MGLSNSYASGRRRRRRRRRRDCAESIVTSTSEYFGLRCARAIEGSPRVGGSSVKIGDSGRAERRIDQDRNPSRIPLNLSMGLFVESRQTSKVGKHRAIFDGCEVCSVLKKLSKEA